MSISSVTPATDVPSWTASRSPTEWDEWRSPEAPRRPDSQDPQMSIRSTTPERAHPSTSRAPCPGCRRLMPVTKAGLIRVHGPVSKRCTGFGRPPSLIEQTADCEALSSLQCPPPTPHPIERYLADPPYIHTVPRRLSCKVLKRIPRASRMPAANKLATILDDIVRRNDDASWDRLFRFCYRCLRVLKRGGHRRSLAGEVNLLLRDEADPPPSTQSGNQHPRPAHAGPS